MRSNDWIDGALYPDVEPPEKVETISVYLMFSSSDCQMKINAVLEIRTSQVIIRET
jgi:hypothetical protein